MAAESVFDFASLDPITEFEGVVDPARYRALPASWSVVLTDVRGSTRAIEAGRYKDVNAIGAASIVALKNALRGRPLPYVFGGDGTTALVENERLEDVRRTLRGVRAMARQAFDLELRVAVVPVSDLLDAGAPVLVARYELASSISIAMFSGPGLGLAESWVKSAAHGPKYDVVGEVPAAADFTGFECRWRPVPSEKGRVVSVLVEALGASEREKTQSYGGVLARLGRLLGGRDGCPLRARDLRLSSVFSEFREELAVRTAGASPEELERERRRIRRKTAIGRFLIAAGLKGGDFDGRTYRDELVRHSDYRKFDGVLRMVLDLSLDQLEELSALLESERLAGRIVYGLHASQAALVTCSVDDYQHNHVHFVDGSDGGYALAAKDLKRQKASETPAAG